MASRSEEPSDRKETPVAEELLFNTKKIDFLGTTTPIILQNKNGPCALLAIANALLLSGKLTLPPYEFKVSQSRLLQLVSACLVATISKVVIHKVQGQDAKQIVDRHAVIGDAIKMLPGLLRGLDVNVKFNGINDFDWESIRERIIFQLLDIPLHHGWLVDPIDLDTARAIGTKSYDELQKMLTVLDAIKTDALNKTETVKPTSASDSTGQLMLKHQRLWTGYLTSLKADKSSASESEKREICTSAPNVDQEVPKDMTGEITSLQGKVIDKFLKENATQLTPHGLYCLRHQLSQEDICVFFRNNHFNTMFMLADELYLLVTDEGYKDQPDVVWKRLDKVQVNKTVFVQSNFNSVKPMSNDRSNFKCFKPSYERQNEKVLQEQELKLKSDPPASFPSESVVGPKVKVGRKTEIRATKKRTYDFEQAAKALNEADRSNSKARKS